VEAPATAADAAALLCEAALAGRSVRARGGGTKWDWGRAAPDPDLVLSTERLDRIREHNAGDLTAVLEAGVRLADAQAAFAGAGQMLALDPPLGADDRATVGGVVATADAGPLRHRYGAARDLLLGVTVALPDGRVARAGGKVIKNVAGYDLAKLFAGSFGTLGAIIEVVVRLHPRPAATATAVGESDNADALARATAALAAAPLELEALDVRWARGRGAVLARVGGVAVGARVAAVADALHAAGLETSVGDDDEALWAAQRGDQRSSDGVVVRVSGLPADLARTLGIAERRGASLVGRAALGVSWLVLPAASPDDVAALRRELDPSPAVLLDAPRELRERVDVWGAADEPLRRLTRRVTERFDPTGALAPGVLDA
jgi:glycolate oxidase FAD binding subunit